MTTGLNAYKALDGTIGVNFGITKSTQEHKLGAMVSGDKGTDWIYVLATAAITANTVVAINNTFSATVCGTAPLATGTNIGFSQVAFAAGDYGWVALRGSALSVLVSGTATGGVQLYVGASGALSTTATSGTIEGVVLVTTTSATAVAAVSTVIASWPHGKTL